MKPMVRTVLLVMLTVVLALTTTGCWNRREIEKLSFVLGAGIDSTPQGFLLSAQVANPSAMTKKAGNAPTFFTFTSTGQTMFDSLRKATHSSPFRLFWAHTKVIVISEEFARKGIMPVMEYFSRDAETRRNFTVAITPKRAEDILKMKVETEKVPVLALMDLLEGYKASSTTPRMNVNDFMRTYHTSTSILVPVVRKVVNQGSKEDYYVQGSAVFTKDKLITYLDPIETRGALWVRGQVKSAILVTPCPDGKGKDKRTQKVSFEVFTAKADIKPAKKGKDFTITVKIKEAGNLAGAVCTKNEVNPTDIKKLEDLKSNKIKAEVMKSLKKARAHKVDVFGFGEAIHRKYPKDWKKIKDRWPDYFAKIPVSVEVETNINSSALIQRQK
ncbi:Ger(x)C family spore germination protein [Brevibacillus ginsengisoli]|uniref:Ger(x)C family spore germination protein n=1 Tax=Brevibacillus ginsengisoli TaxID=363854 RepID=UPI003CEBE89E